MKEEKKVAIDDSESESEDELMFFSN